MLKFYEFEIVAATFIYIYFFLFEYSCKYKMQLGRFVVGFWKREYKECSVEKKIGDSKWFYILMIKKKLFAVNLLSFFLVYLDSFYGTFTVSNKLH